MTVKELILKIKTDKETIVYLDENCRATLTPDWIGNLSIQYGDEDSKVSYEMLRDKEVVFISIGSRIVINVKGE